MSENISKKVKVMARDNGAFLRWMVFVGASIFFFEQIDTIDKKMNALGQMVKTDIKMRSLQPVKEVSNYGFEEVKDAIAANNRFASIYQGNLIRKAESQTPTALSFYEELENQIKLDSRDLVVFNKLLEGVQLPPAIHNEGEGSVEFFDKWHFPVESAESAWLKNFPARPFLAFNSEIVQWPNCKEGEVESLIVQPISRIGQPFVGEVKVVELGKINAWQIQMEGVGELDPAVAINQRVMAISSCAAA